MKSALEFLAITAIVILIASLLIAPAVGIGWYGSSINRKLINERFGTTYTTKEVFWAGETIEKLLEGEKQVVSLELSKQLKEAGYKQEGLWWWIHSPRHFKFKNLKHYKENKWKGDWGLEEWRTMKPLEGIVAPTVAELGERLPARWFSSRKTKYNEWICETHKLVKQQKDFIADTEANARVKMWLYLKKEGKL